MKQKKVIHTLGKTKYKHYFCTHKQIEYIMSYKITPEIKLSASKRGYDLWYVNARGVNVLHKKNLTLDEAQRESVALCGHIRLWMDIFKKA